MRLSQTSVPVPPLDTDEDVQWFRLYDDVLDDPKVQRLPPDLFKHWINLLCLANKGGERGRLPELDDMAFRLRVSRDEMTDILVALSQYGLLARDAENRLIPHNWDERQRRSDDVSERVKAHRARNVTPPEPCNVTDPLHVTAPDTDTDTDTEQRKRQREKSPPIPPRGNGQAPYPQAFEAFWSRVVRKEPSKSKAHDAWVKAKTRTGASDEEILAGLLRWCPVHERIAAEDITKVPHITTWLNQDRWTVEEPGMPRAPTSNGHPNDARKAAFANLAREMWRGGNDGSGHREPAGNGRDSLPDGHLEAQWRPR